MERGYRIGFSLEKAGSTSRRQLVSLPPIPTVAMAEVSDFIAALAAAAKRLQEVKKVARQFIRGQLVN
jgi:hypothetical protein